MVSEDISYKCRCPKCSSFVEPITAGFYNCQYRWAGEKIGKNSSDDPLICKQEHFQLVGEEYLRFDETPQAEGGNGIAIIELNSLRLLDTGRMQYFNAISFF